MPLIGILKLKMKEPFVEITLYVIAASSPHIPGLAGLIFVTAMLMPPAEKFPVLVPGIL